MNLKILKQFQFSLSDLENVSPELTEPSLDVCVGPFCIRTQQVCVSVRRPPFCSETVLNVFESINLSTTLLIVRYSEIRFCASCTVADLQCFIHHTHQQVFNVTGDYNQ